MRIATRLALALVIGLTDAACGKSLTGPSGELVFQITVKSTAITNQSGRVLIMTIQQEGQSTVIGRACEGISSSPFTLSASAITAIAASGNLCDQGAPKNFPAGRYTLTAGIWAPPNFPPNQAAETTTTQTVVVVENGESKGTVATIDGAALSRDSIPVVVTLTILPATLPTLTVGVPVTIQLTVVGGTGTGLVWSPSTTGTQIPGLFISTDGVLSGTPTTAGPYTRGFTVVDSAGNTGSILYTGTVNAR